MLFPEVCRYNQDFSNNLGLFVAVDKADLVANSSPLVVSASDAV